MVVNMGSVSATRKRVKVSKNKKKSWSKFCDVKDVEEYLEEKRFEERIGGAVSEKTDAELFFVQTGTEETAVSKKIKKPLKCHQNIGAFSQVQPPVNLTLNRYSKRIKNALDRTIERKAKKILRKASAEKPKQEPEKNVLKGDLFTGELQDLWSKEKEDVDPEVEDLVQYRDEITKKRTPKVPCHRFQKPSLLPPVEVPHAGASYNPSFIDHQDLLQEAVKIEEKKQKEELHLKRVLTDMFPTKAEAPTPESILEEMSQGLFEGEDPEEDESESLYTTRNPPVKSEDRLPKSRKRKRKELKEQARKLAEEKLAKKRLHDVYRIRSIKSEIKKEEKVSDLKHKKKIEREIEQMYKPRALSKHKYESPDVELNLTEELTGSLRTLKTDGNLLEDRYKSLQRRNLIEP
ncbi:hypothetical protein X975_12422, partial [Stegodyphus mimosarum]